MIDGTEKPKIPSKFAKCTAQYNEFGYNITNDSLMVAGLLTKRVLIQMIR